MIITSTFAFLVVVVIAAIVVDLAAIRNVRAHHQIAADTATTAASSRLADVGGREACETAKGYLIETGFNGASGLDCTSIPVACSGTTPSAQTSVTAGSVRIRIAHPIESTDAMMQPGVIGAPTQSISASDGDPLRPGRC